MISPVIDAYSFFSRHPVGELVSLLSEMYDAKIESDNHRYMGYDGLIRLLWGKTQVLQILWSQARLAWVRIYGDTSRLAWENRSVLQVDGIQRIDSAVDIDDGPGTFDKLLSVVQDIRSRYSLTESVRGDWFSGAVNGRTYYLGKRTGEYFVRLYEKGKKNRHEVDVSIANKLPIISESDIDVFCSSDLCRLELEYKPAKSQRQLACQDDAITCWHHCNWTSELFNLLYSSHHQIVHIPVTRHDDDIRAVAHMITQYRGCVASIMSDPDKYQQFLDLIRSRWGLFFGRVGQYLPGGYNEISS